MAFTVCSPALVRTALRVAWLVALAPAMAQDRFGDAPPAQPGTQRIQRSAATPLPQARSAPQPQSRTQKPDPAPADAGEGQDFGVAPVARLQPTAQLHGPTPTSIPGGKVVGTRQLAAWMQGQQGAQGRVMLLHAIGSNEHLPHAIPVVPASQGGSFSDQVQREFGQYLEQATGGDRNRLIVTYCAGVECWGSYNAALRAIHMGYRNVHWYRGGMDAWRAAGLPLLVGNGPQ